MKFCMDNEFFAHGYRERFITHTKISRIMNTKDKMEKLKLYAKNCEEATKNIDAKYKELRAKHKKLKKDMKVLEEREVKRARLDPATIAKIVLPEKIRPHHVRVEKQQKISTFSIEDLRDVETVFRALGSSSAQTIADGIFDLLNEKETDEDQMKGMRSCIETLRSRSQSSLKRYALERMLWELRKRIVRRLFSSTTTSPVRLFSAYVSVSSVEDTADLQSIAFDTCTLVMRHVHEFVEKLSKYSSLYVSLV